MEVTDIGGLGVSPDGRRLAFRTERADIGGNRYQSEWFIYAVDKGRVIKIGSGGEPVFVDPGVSQGERPVWAKDSRSIFYRALTDRRVQVWQAGVDGSGPRMVIADDADIVSIDPSEDGRSIAYTIGPTRAEIEQAERSEYDNGILVDESIDLGQPAFRGAIINGRPATQRLTGDWFNRGGLLWRAPMRQRRFDPATGETTDISVQTSADEKGAPSLSEATSRNVRNLHGDMLQATWADGRGTLSVISKEGKRTDCPHVACRMRTAWRVWRSGYHEVLFATTDPANDQTIWSWLPSSGGVRKLAGGVGLLSGGRDGSRPCGVTDDFLLCVTATAASPPRLERIDITTGARLTLFDPNAELRASYADIVAEPLVWLGSGGQRFYGTMFGPRGQSSARLPLFINYYDCEGFLRGGTGDEWPLAPLAGAGMRTICINTANSTGNVDPVEQYRTALDGIKVLIAKLDRQGRVDPKKVGMGGLSFGGEVTMWVATHSGLLAAASITSPVVEPSYYWLEGVRGRDTHKALRDFWGLGSPDETPDRWKLLSPALNIDQIRTPLLLQMPEQEARVMLELYSKLTNTTVPTELYIFPDEPHIKVQPRHLAAAYTRNFDWFRFWLQGNVDQAPVKARQNERWLAAARRFRTASNVQVEPAQIQTRIDQ